MLKKVVLFIAAVSVIQPLVAALVFPPQRWEKVTVNANYRNTETYQRQWELLHFSEWGVTPIWIRGCGPNGGSTIRSWRFGFFALSDKHGSWNTTTQDRERMKQPLEKEQNQRVTAGR